jgi:hypothetical protein
VKTAREGNQTRPRSAEAAVRHAPAIGLGDRLAVAVLVTLVLASPLIAELLIR